MRIRPERVANALRREVAEILATRMRDPRISQWVSVTDVVVTRDPAKMLPAVDNRTIQANKGDRVA